MKHSNCNCKLQSCDCHKETACTCKQETNTCNTCKPKQPTCNSCQVSQQACIRPIEPMFAPRHLQSLPKNRNLVEQVGDGKYEIRTTLDKRTGSKFFAKTHTKAVVDNQGNTVDSIIKDIYDKLEYLTKAAYSKNPGDIPIKDNFYSDTAFYALSAGRGRYLYNALRKSEDVELITHGDSAVLAVRPDKFVPREEYDKMMKDFEEVKLISCRTNKLLKLFNKFIEPRVVMTAPDWDFVQYLRGYSYEFNLDNLSHSAILKSQFGDKVTPIKVQWSINEIDELHASKYKVTLVYTKFGKEFEDVIFEGEPSDLKANEVIGYISPDRDTEEIKANVSIWYDNLVEYSGSSSLVVKSKYDFDTDFEDNVKVGVDYLGYEYMDEVYGPQKLNYPCTIYSPVHHAFLHFENEEQRYECLSNHEKELDLIEEVKPNTLYYSKTQQECGTSDHTRYFFYKKSEYHSDSSWVEVDLDGKLLVMDLINLTHYE